MQFGIEKIKRILMVEDDHEFSHYPQKKNMLIRNRLLSKIHSFHAYGGICNTIKPYRGIKRGVFF